MDRRRSTTGQRLGAALVALGLLAAACSSESSVPTLEPTPESEVDSTTLSDVDVSGGEVPLDDRSPVPGDAIPVATLLTDPDPEDIEEARDAADEVGKIVITADFEGCLLLSLWGLPSQNVLIVGVEFDDNTDCARAFEYTAVFAVPLTGTNSEGTWNFDEDTTARVMRQELT